MAKRTMRDAVAALALAFAAVLVHANPRDPVAAATELFQKYVAFGESYDARLVELYADDATVRNRRVLPTGESREMALSGAQYKQLMAAALPMAKARGDRSTYSEVTYAQEGNGVRIKATRYSELKRYSSPVSWLVRPGPDGNWRIVEESSESRP